MTHGPRLTKPRGGMLFELIGSITLLGAVLVIIARVSVATDAQARLAEQRELASRTLQNAMEEMAVSTPGQRLAKAEAPLLFDDEVALRLSDVELTADVAPIDGSAETLGGQRATLRLEWTPTPGARPTTLALTAYFYPAASTAESEANK